jgi:hypothetical protein
MSQAELADTSQLGGWRGCVLGRTDHQVVGIRRNLTQDAARVAAHDTSYQHRSRLNLGQGVRDGRILYLLGTNASLLGCTRGHVCAAISSYPYGDDVQAASAQPRLAHRERESLPACLAAVDTDDDPERVPVVHGIPSVAADLCPMRATLTSCSESPATARVGRQVPNGT